jgi:signal transduction histidine kinase
LVNDRSLLLSMTSAAAPPVIARDDAFSGVMILRISVVAAIYVAAGRLGLTLDAVSGFASLVWPGSGIALAALLLGGRSLWPAIAVGAFITNAWAGAPIVAAAAIAAGNTLEAVIGASLLQKLPGFSAALLRVRDMVALILVAAIGSTVVAATVGAWSLRLSGVAAPDAFWQTWSAWWLGDAIGVLSVGTLILAWAQWKPRLPRAIRMGESLALGAAIVIASFVVFGLGQTPAGATRGREYMLFPPLIWAALRFGLKGGITSTIVVMIVAIVETSAGRGPFVRDALHESLTSLQAFMGILGATVALLGASISERRRAAKELRTAREVAEAANRAKANFLGVVSHELRTPLNAITGYVDLLSLELDGPLNPKQRHSLDRIVHSQQHLLALIEDVLSFAQTEAGRLSFSLQPVQVASTLDSVKSIVAAEAARKQISLRVAECDPEVKVKADADKLRQVLLNLITNAMKFTSAGGEIAVAALPDHHSVRIAVQDSGIGISPEHIDKVFDPFFQVDQGGTRRYPGVGLGLSIVRDAVIAMGGQVGIESKLGQGTIAYITLPREFIRTDVGSWPSSTHQESAR